MPIKEKSDWEKIMKEHLQSPQKMDRELLMIDFPEVYPKSSVLLQIRQLAADTLGVDSSDVPQAVPPPQEIDANLAFPTFTLARVLHKKPQTIASELVENVSLPKESVIAYVENKGPYVNFKLDYSKYGELVLSSIENSKSSYGAENIGQGKVVIVDMSSPNVAKPMHVAHLRSTIIGHSISRTLEFQGYTVIKDNHLGDWGRQFGMLLKAVELWGDEIPELYQEGQQVKGLLKLYIKIHHAVDEQKFVQISDLREKVNKMGMDSVEGFEKAYNQAYSNLGSREAALEETLAQFTTETELERAGRELFRKLEKGDPKARHKWTEILQLSVKEFEEVYKILGVDFDYALGESFYNEMLPYVMEEVKKQPYVYTTEDGAIIADLDDVKLGKMVIQTRDGRSLYVTRDLATAIFREEFFEADKVKYVVGSEQIHYFRQWFEILKRMGYKISTECQHIYFGAVTLPEGKMSSREGRVIFLRDVLEESILRAEQIIQKKNPNLFGDANKRLEVAKQIGIGAVIWNDISKDAKRTITFNWNDMLSLEGYSAPYVQYAHARAANILKRSQEDGNYKNDLENNLVIETQVEEDLISLLSDFPEIVKRASEANTPSTIAVYVYELAQLFNKFYVECSVLKEVGNIRYSRLRLVTSTKQVIKNSLYLLGIESPEEM